MKGDTISSLFMTPSSSLPRLQLIANWLSIKPNVYGYTIEQHISYLEHLGDVLYTGDQKRRNNRSFNVPMPHQFLLEQYTCCKHEEESQSKPSQRKYQSHRRAHPNRSFQEGISHTKTSSLVFKRTLFNSTSRSPQCCLQSFSTLRKTAFTL